METLARLRKELQSKLDSDSTSEQPASNVPSNPSGTSTSTTSTSGHSTSSNSTVSGGSGEPAQETSIFSKISGVVKEFQTKLESSPSTSTDAQSVTMTTPATPTAATVTGDQQQAPDAVQETSIFSKFTEAVKEFQSKKPDQTQEQLQASTTAVTQPAESHETSTSLFSKFTEVVRDFQSKKDAGQVDAHDTSSVSTGEAPAPGAPGSTTPEKTSPQAPDRAAEKNALVSRISLAVKELLVSTQGTNEVNEATPQFQKLVDELDALLRHGLKAKSQFFGLKSAPPSYWPYVVLFTSKGTVSMLERQFENIQQREKAWVELAVADNACVNYFETFKSEPAQAKTHYEDYSLMLDDERLSIAKNLFISLQATKFSIPSPPEPSPATVAPSSVLPAPTTTSQLAVPSPAEAPAQSQQHQQPQPAQVQAHPPKEESLLSRFRISMGSSSNKEEEVKGATSSVEYFPSVQPETAIVPSNLEVPVEVKKKTTKTKKRVPAKKVIDIPEGTGKDVSLAASIDVFVDSTSTSEPKFEHASSFQSQSEPKYFQEAVAQGILSAPTPATEETKSRGDSVFENSEIRPTRASSSSALSEYDEPTAPAALTSQVPTTVPSVPVVAEASTDIPTKVNKQSQPPAVEKEADIFQPFESPTSPDALRKESYGAVLRRHVYSSDSAFAPKKGAAAAELPSFMPQDEDELTFGKPADTKGERKFGLKSESKSSSLSSLQYHMEGNDTVVISSATSSARNIPRSSSQLQVEDTLSFERDAFSVPSEHHPRTGSQILSSATSMFTSVFSVATNLISNPLGKPDDEFHVVEDFMSTEKHSLSSQSGSNLNLAISMEICPEKGLSMQDFKCWDCKILIGMGTFGEERLCDYTGFYYCTECHNNDVAQIPARMVRNWDFKRYRVCKKSKELLKNAFKHPLIPLLTVNPMLETFLEEVRETVRLRKELTILKGYISSCSRLEKDLEMKTKLLKKIWPRDHLMDEKLADMYSIQDILEMEDRHILVVLRHVRDAFKDHVIRSCELCRLKGSYCDFCKEKKIIYPFDLNTVTKCPNCGALAHKTCFIVDKCPTCLRKKALKTQ